ncbi:PREDICTED: 3'-5' exoribonuclease 1 isoform X2 [Cercocebus atys]|uniref:3'-5' exoribonuclease 1 isoform X2 n=1 Tax=Cercocebus atys TaxID=9531 RepID=UPI0005F42DA5|nr:PREDICTED: 3'-5' exoribonuclease 1 isoform X2 [Cercocebus atys]
MEEPQSKEPTSEAVTPVLLESPRPEGREEQPRPSPEETQQYRFDGQETKGSKFITSSVSDFSDPVYKEIAITNGCINRMSKEELRAKLSEFKLETRGVKDVLKKRLKNYYKKQKLMLKESNCADSYYDYICIIDFEATCEEGNPPEFVHEIIEFPVVLLNTHTLEIEDTFQQYVRPEINTQLSDFCISLTGITQDQVDRADTFPQVLKKVIDWMKLKELGTKYKYSILTDGSWDMSKFLNIQCQLSRLKYPPFAKKWINIRKSYGNFYKWPQLSCSGVSGEGSMNGDSHSSCLATWQMGINAHELGEDLMAAHCCINLAKPFYASKPQ